MSYRYSSFKKQIIYYSDLNQFVVIKIQLNILSIRSNSKLKQTNTLKFKLYENL